MTLQEQKIILNSFNQEHSYSDTDNLLTAPDKLSVREKKKIINIIKEKPITSASETVVDT